MVAWWSIGVCVVLFCHKWRSGTRRLFPYGCSCLIDRIVASGRPIAVRVLHSNRFDEQFVTMKMLGSDDCDNRRCFDGYSRGSEKRRYTSSSDSSEETTIRKFLLRLLQPSTIHAEKIVVIMRVRCAGAPLLDFVDPCARVVVGGCPL